MKTIASASILSADFCSLGNEIKRASDSGCEYIHFDVMDGVFVPNISYGIPVLKSVRKATDRILDVHLMITKPLEYVKAFSEAGADIITFHLESQSDVEKTIDAIRGAGKKVGISLKPATSASTIIPYLDKIDMVLVMTVEPGFGGQSFNYDMLEKIKEIRKASPSIDIEVDGGIDKNTAPLVKEAGANVLVSGSYIFKSDDIRSAVESLIKD